MEILVVLLPLALCMGGLFVAAFLWAVGKGQYDDLETPRYRMLLEDISSTLTKKGNDK